MFSELCFVYYFFPTINGALYINIYSCLDILASSQGGHHIWGYLESKSLKTSVFLEYNNMEQAVHKLIIFYLLLDNKKIRRFCQWKTINPN